MELNDPVALQSLDYDILLRIGVAAVIGLFLGLDRELRGHAAGLRTHGLICVAASGTTISVLAIYTQLGPAQMDPLRLFEAAGSFVGIIGAGLIVFSKGRLHNLTTAAHLWLATVIGIACGAAQWPLVAILTLVSLIMVTILRMIESRLERKKRKLAEDQAGAGRQ